MTRSTLLLPSSWSEGSPGPLVEFFATGMNGQLLLLLPLEPEPELAPPTQPPPLPPPGGHGSCHDLPPSSEYTGVAPYPVVRQWSLFLHGLTGGLQQSAADFLRMQPSGAVGQ